MQPDDEAGGGAAPSQGKAWSGRFAEPLDALAQRFNASVGFDRRLAEFDIQGSLAHARMLARAGIIAASEGRLPFYDLYYKEIDLVNSRAAVPGDYARGIELLASKQVQVAPLISASYPLDQGAAAFTAMQTRSDLIKVLLEIG